MKTKIWYIVQGSPDSDDFQMVFMESEALYDIEIKYNRIMCDCQYTQLSGCLIIESDGPIKMVDSNDIMTIDKKIEELEDWFGIEDPKEDIVDVGYGEDYINKFKEIRELKKRIKH